MEEKIAVVRGSGPGQDPIAIPVDPRNNVVIEVIEPPYLDPIPQQQTETGNELTLRRTVSEYPDLKQDVTECHCECEGCAIVSKFLGL